MSGRGRCVSCGAINRDDAPFCTQCFTRNPLTDSAPTPYATPGAPIGFAPAMAAPGVGTFPLAEQVGQRAMSRTSALDPVGWRWKQIWTLGFVVWMLPGIVNLFFGSGGAMSSIIDRSMMIQIGAYLVGGFMLWSLIQYSEGGDWSALGFKVFSGRELAFGALFGLALLGAFVPIGKLLNQGPFGVDPMVRLLVGGASGAGVWLVAIVVGIGAPVLEEIYFRGLMYEKLRRLSVWIAIPVTAVLFTLAHGALLIPAILMMGFVLGIARLKRSLWFTIGTHSAWNFSILFIGIAVMGGSFTYGTSSDPFSLSYPNTWHQSDEARALAGPRPDVALSSPAGSMASFAYEKSAWPSAEMTLKSLVHELTGLGMGQDLPTGAAQMKPLDIDFGTLVQGYELEVTVPGPVAGQPLYATLVVVQRPSSRRALIAEFSCVRAVCEDELPEFDEMLGSIRLFKW